MEYILSRKSIRKFKSDSVSNEMVNQILEAAMAAPCAMNQQPWHFVVITNREKLDLLASSSKFYLPLKTAPMAIMVAKTKEAVPVEVCVDYDLAIASENIMLAANYLGLGSVWLAVKPDPERMKLVGDVVGDNTLEVLNIIPIGYSDTYAEYKSKFDINKITYIN